MLKTEPHVTRRSLTSSTFSAPSVSARRLRTSSKLDVTPVQLGAHDRRQRRLLEVGDHVDQVGIAERAPSRRDGCVFAGRRACRARTAGRDPWRGRSRGPARTPRTGRRNRRCRRPRGARCDRRRSGGGPCPAACSSANWSQSESSSGGDKVGSSKSSGVPTGRTTISASPFWARPAVTTSGTRTPAREARNVMKPSCSTSSERPSRVALARVAVPEARPRRSRSARRPRRRGRRP